MFLAPRPHRSPTHTVAPTLKKYGAHGTQGTLHEQHHGPNALHSAHSLHQTILVLTWGASLHTAHTFQGNIRDFENKSREVVMIPPHP